MAEPTKASNLTPQFCFTTGALREFLRLSRSSIDDSITQNLNALVTPARAGFDPSSTSHRTPRSGLKQIDPEACQTFKDQVLFPTWQARTDVLYYCGVVASSPDPDDPEATLRELEKEKDSQRVVDERLDPYSARFFPREARTETLATLIRQETQVENIVRTRTWATVQERCGGTGDTWEQAANRWAETRAAHPGR
ncbi:Caffeine-induced death protein-like protein [Hapsidospora chrysogenum ATCC 11550]|uniref:Caffeine-induced death protein-like protein n=1 Tax=Hapsidospora chrysogenum (strain ATCC 11550 / CBS 779.69 / DSM 880 / IAM 14645 / JCM 23072 / IMI 49137) TaxID=857340 RepID=A0A086T0G2_HAPC1|nr:Caffeine-induced death protein-like protein [Hapsidospora chrysogenum ATCC 11550]